MTSGTAIAKVSVAARHGYVERGVGGPIRSAVLWLWWTV
jgi:hypothetical protein